MNNSNELNLAPAASGTQSGLSESPGEVLTACNTALTIDSTVTEKGGGLSEEQPMDSKISSTQPEKLLPYDLEKGKLLPIHNSDEMKQDRNETKLPKTQNTFRRDEISVEKDQTPAEKRVIGNNRSAPDPSMDDRLLAEKIAIGCALARVRLQAKLDNTVAAEGKAGLSTAVDNDSTRAIETSEATLQPLQPLRNAMSTVKQREKDGGEEPGAYRLNSRTSGPAPAWVRNRDRSSCRLISQGSSTSMNDQTQLPPEMHVANQHGIQPSPTREEALDPNGISLIMTAEVSEHLQPPTDSKQQRRRKFNIAASIIIIIVAAIGVGVGFAVTNSDENNQNEDDNIGYFSKVWEKCLYHGSFEDISDKERTDYKTLKEDLFANSTHNGFDHNISSCEAPNLALHWLVEDSLRNTNLHNDSLLDRYALTACYLSWTLDNPYEWNNASGWMTSKSVCSWFGITCNNVTGYATHIRLGNNRLSGSIPKELSFLSQLLTLNLQKNNVTGTIPTEIGRLGSLVRLYLQGNGIGGSIPKEIGQLSMLQRFDMEFNQLTGSIPTNVGSCAALRSLNLQHNQIDGTIPSEIGLLSNIEVMSVSINYVAGSIPTNIGSCANMQQLDLYSNRIEGTIPSEIGLLSNLVHIGFSTNKLAGSIPSTIGNLQNITRLNLYRNRLTGTMPSEIGSCTSLQTFNIETNYLTGAIPTEIGSLTALTELSIPANYLSGSIPSHLGSCLNLKFLDLSENLRMRGSVPWEIENLVNLQMFFYVGTRLTGTISDGICSLRESNLTY
eukprot:CAMPEP_0178922382 /NCGR_PEP_ID=MMETSP0786-20121207/16120_1 /TAXON_ID=186022 /ORGANISM="Thalassionema frauenfeldii, Strain CCMP 1798" /LENGTH=781 /DNA_ID=CAMNT_0020596735 /DNA_START=245 /DNA_END=2587 /DNA_ORIENTATION=-